MFTCGWDYLQLWVSVMARRGLWVIKLKLRLLSVLRAYWYFSATDCSDIMSQGHSAGDGMYWIVPDGGSHSNVFLAYCDMTSYNGGWTMCYTTDEYAKPKTEVTYNTTFPYRTDGYRTNCNEIEVSSCIWYITPALPLTSRGTQWVCSSGKF